MSRYLERYRTYYRRGLYKTTQPIVEVTDDHVQQIVDKLSEHPYMDGWDLFLFGSKASDEVSRDLDLYFTKVSGLTDTELTYDEQVEVAALINETYRICIEELNIKVDVFYIQDTEPLYEEMTEDNKEDTFTVQTTTDFDFEIKDGQLVRFLDYKFGESKNGLFDLELKVYHQKSVDSGITKRVITQLI